MKKELTVNFLTLVIASSVGLKEVLATDHPSSLKQVCLGAHSILDAKRGYPRRSCIPYLRQAGFLK